MYSHKNNQSTLNEQRYEWFWDYIVLIKIIRQTKNKRVKDNKKRCQCGNHTWEEMAIKKILNKSMWCLVLKNSVW